MTEESHNEHRDLNRNKGCQPTKKGSPVKRDPDRLLRPFVSANVSSTSLFSSYRSDSFRLSHSICFVMSATELCAELWDHVLAKNWPDALSVATNIEKLLNDGFLDFRLIQTKIVPA